MITVLLLGTALVGFIPQWRKHASHESRLEELREDKARAQERLQELRVRQDRFLNDPNYVRRVAHEIGLVEEHEVVFRFYDNRRDASPR